MSENPLLIEFDRIQPQIDRLKERAKKFYFQVMLSQYVCPQCSKGLRMTGISKCTCEKGHTFDPTKEFQKSHCCNARLVRKTSHYLCSRCKKIVPSRFLFDEKIFDSEYFSQMMKRHRERIQKRKKELIEQLNQSRSCDLTFLDEPHLESIPGLIEDLDQFVGADDADSQDPAVVIDPGFAMSDYRNHILSTLNFGSRLFSNISTLSMNPRTDRAFRFATLIFMEHDQEVEITQYDNDLLIERRI